MTPSPSPNTSATTSSNDGALSHTHLYPTHLLLAPSPKAQLHWTHLVHAEIINVIHTMRKNQRYSVALTSSYQQHMNGGLSTSSSPSHGNNGGYGWKRDWSHTMAFVENALTTGEFLLLTPSQLLPVQSSSTLLSNAAATGNASMDETSKEREVVAPKPHKFTVGPSQENTIIRNFTRLKAKLMTVKELRDMDPMELLGPFLEVIKSGDTTGAMTGAALDTVENFIKYKIIDPRHPLLAPAMSALTHAVTHCKFEATDAVADEVVLSRILKLLRTAVESEAGLKSLDDKGICEMVEAAFGMCFQGRVSELLRRSAEQTLHVLVQAMFERLTLISRHYEQEFNKLWSPTVLSSASTLFPSSQPSQDQQQAQQRPAPSKSPSPSTSSSRKHHPFGLPSILELVRVLVSLVDPRNRQHTDTMHRVVALRLLLVAVEVGGDSLGKWIGWGFEVEKKWQNRHQMRKEQQQQQQQAAMNKEQQPAPTTITQPQPESQSQSEQNESHDELERSASEELTIHTEIGQEVVSFMADGGVKDMVDMSSRRAESQAVLTTSDNDTSMNTVDEVDNRVQISNANSSSAAATAAPTAESATSATATGRRSSAQSQDKEKEQEREREKEMKEFYDDATEIELLALGIKNLMFNDLCRFMFQILRTMDNITVYSPPSPTTLTLLQLTLRLLTSLFQMSRHHFKHQQGFLLKTIMERLDTGVVTWDIAEEETNGNNSQHHSQSSQRSRSVSSQASSMHHHGSYQTRPMGPVVPEVREIMMETLLQFSRIPGFMAELYVNYDGDTSCQGHAFQELVQFLSKHSFPDVTPGGPITSPVHQLICFDALLLALKNMAERRSQVSSQDFSMPPASVILDNVGKKRMLQEAANRFNEKPTKGIEFLQENGLLPNPADPDSLSKFLLTTPNLNKKLLGDYLSKPANLELLKAFIGLFDFRGKRIDEAVRMLLEAFRLPGEAQQIGRILETFADHYHAGVVALGNTDNIVDADSVYVLAYSIIMLNTDQHNPQVRNKMTLEDFVRNNRGTNGGKDFALDYLTAIYHAIRGNEIVMPEEHEGELGFNYTWKELLKKANQNSYLLCKSNIYDRDMFLFSWAPCLAAISYVFDIAEDDLTLQKAALGFHHIAMLGAHFRVPQVLDNIMMTLCRITGLNRDSSSHNTDNESSSSRSRSKDPSDTRYWVDRWAVDFGRNYKGQIAALMMFRFASDYGNWMRVGWKSIIDCVRNLFLHTLLSESLIQTEDFVKGTITIPLLSPPPSSSNSNTKRNELSYKRDGLFSTFAQLLSIGAPEDDEYYPPTEEELDAESRAKACVSRWKLEGLFKDSRFLEEDALKALLGTILAASFADVEQVFTPTKMQQEETERKSQDSSDEQQQQQQQQSPKFNSAAIFFLELMINIAIQNRDRIGIVWNDVAKHIESILTSTQSSCPPLLVERTVVSLLRLCIRLVHKEDIIAEVFKLLDTLRNLPSDIMASVSEQMMAGVLVLVKTNMDTLRNHGRLETIMSLLSACSVYPEAAKYAFEAVAVILAETTETGNPSQPSIINHDNFGEYVDLLISFAGAARVMAVSGNNASIHSDDDGFDSSSDRKSSRNESPRPTGRPGSGRNVSPSNVARTPSSQASIDRAIKAVEQLYKLHAKIPLLTEGANIKSERAWYEFWLPILSGLGQQCYHPCREVRQTAVTFLQRALLSPELDKIEFPELFIDLFEHILFPLLEELLKREVASLDPKGMDETRMRASGLMCKIFLHHFGKLIKCKDVKGLWVRMLEYLCRYMNAGETDFLNEGVLESLKNLLLVLSTQGAFQYTLADGQSGATEGSNVLWELTWAKIDPVLPGLRDELFPPAPPGLEAAPPKVDSVPTTTGEPDQEVKKEEIGEESIL